MNKKRKRYIIIMAFAFIAILVIIATNKKGQGTDVSIDYPKRSTIVESIPANGKIQPVTEVKISPDVSGEIIELHIKEGDKVKAGDLLIKIRQDLYISAVERAEASLNAIKAQYLQQKAQFVQTELSFKRNKSLYEQKTISDAEYETSLSQYNVADQQLNAAHYNVRSAEAALKEAEESLQKTTIYAPMTGIISKLDVEKGERVVGTSQMAGTEMLRIANFNEMEVLVDVNENDIIKVSLSDTAHVEVDAYPNRKFKGIVTQIANSAKNTGSAASLDQVTNFEVHVAILPESYEDLLQKEGIPFRPGMSASVEIHTETEHNALVVPLQAITTRENLIKNSNDNTAVECIFVYNPITSKVSPMKVTTGIQDMKQIVVESGISDSTLIVTGPYSAITRSLKDGSIVNATMESKEL